MKTKKTSLTLQALYYAITDNGRACLLDDLLIEAKMSPKLEGLLRKFAEEHAHRSFYFSKRELTLEERGDTVCPGFESLSGYERQHVVGYLPYFAQSRTESQRKGHHDTHAARVLWEHEAEGLLMQAGVKRAYLEIPNFKELTRLPMEDRAAA